MAQEIKTVFTADTSQLKSEVSSVTASIGGLKSVVGSLGALVGIHSLVESIKKMAEKAEELDRTAAVLGTTANEVQTLSKALRPFDVDLSSASASIYTMGRKLGDFTAISEKSASALAELGLDPANLQAKTSVQRFKDIALALSKVGDAGKRSKLASEFFGKGASAIMPALSRGPKELSEEWEKASKSIKISDETIKTFEGLHKTMMALSGAQLSAGMRVAGPAAKVLADALAKALATLSRMAADGTFDRWGEELAGFARTAKTGFDVILGFFAGKSMWRMMFDLAVLKTIMGGAVEIIKNAFAAGMSGFKAPQGQQQQQQMQMQTAYPALAISMAGSRGEGREASAPKATPLAIRGAYETHLKGVVRNAWLKSPGEKIEKAKGLKNKMLDPDTWRVEEFMLRRKLSKLVHDIRGDLEVAKSWDRHGTSGEKIARIGDKLKARESTLESRLKQPEYSKEERAVIARSLEASRARTARHAEFKKEYYSSVEARGLLQSRISPVKRASDVARVASIEKEEAAMSGVGPAMSEYRKALAKNAGEMHAIVERSAQFKEHIFAGTDPTGAKRHLMLSGRAAPVDVAPEASARYKELAAANRQIHRQMWTEAAPHVKGTPGGREAYAGYKTRVSHDVSVEAYTRALELNRGYSESIASNMQKARAETGKLGSGFQAAFAKATGHVENFVARSKAGLANIGNQIWSVFANPMMWAAAIAAAMTYFKFLKQQVLDLEVEMLKMNRTTFTDQMDAIERTKDAINKRYQAESEAVNDARSAHAALLEESLKAIAKQVGAVNKLKEEYKGLGDTIENNNKKLIDVDQEIADNEESIQDLKKKGAAAEVSEIRRTAASMRDNFKDSKDVLEDLDRISTSMLRRLAAGSGAAFAELIASQRPKNFEEKQAASLGHFIKGGKGYGNDQQRAQWFSGFFRKELAIREVEERADRKEFGRPAGNRVQAQEWRDNQTAVEEAQQRGKGVAQATKKHSELVDKRAAIVKESADAKTRREEIVKSMGGWHMSAAEKNARAELEATRRTQAYLEERATNKNLSPAQRKEAARQAKAVAATIPDREREAREQTPAEGKRITETEYQIDTIIKEAQKLAGGNVEVAKALAEVQKEMLTSEQKMASDLKFFSDSLGNIAANVKKSAAGIVEQDARLAKAAKQKEDDTKAMEDLETKKFGEQKSTKAFQEALGYAGLKSEDIKTMDQYNAVMKLYEDMMGTAKEGSKVTGVKKMPKHQWPNIMNAMPDMEKREPDYTPEQKASLQKSKAAAVEAIRNANILYEANKTILELERQILYARVATGRMTGEEAQKELDRLKALKAAEAVPKPVKIVKGVEEPDDVAGAPRFSTSVMMGSPSPQLHADNLRSASAAATAAGAVPYVDTSTIEKTLASIDTKLNNVTMVKTMGTTRR